MDLPTDTQTQFCDNVRYRQVELGVVEGFGGILITLQDLDQKLIYLLMEINVVMLFPSRGASIFGLTLVLKKGKSHALCKVSSRLSMNLSSGLRGADSCVKTILHPPNHFFTI